MRSKKYRTLEESLIEWLGKDPSRAEVFLSTQLEEYARDDNLKQLVYSLHCIATAKGKVLQLVDSSKADKQRFDKLLADDHNPSWNQVITALTT